MTIDQLIDRLQTIKGQVGGDLPVKAWDPDVEEWEEVSTMIYAREQGIWLYTDQD